MTSQVFVITECAALAGSMGRYFRHIRGIALSYRPKPRLVDGDPAGPVHAFRHLANWIEGLATDTVGYPNLRGAVGFIDLYDEHLPAIEALDPLATNQGPWPAVVGMLLLAFPEIHWVILSPYHGIKLPMGSDAHLFGDSMELNGKAGFADGSRADVDDPPSALAQVLRISDEGFTPLFDPTGFRAMLRDNMRGLSQNGVARYIPVRSQSAAAVDEEDAYAFFNAYAAYRFGFRSHVVSTHALLQRFFEKLRDSRAQASDGRVTLTFEDLYLRFPDSPPHTEIHLSDLAQRDEAFPGLAAAQYRIFVTAGHRRGVEEGRWDKNSSRLDAWRAVETGGGRRWSAVLLKPFSGLFDLWERSGLRARLWSGTRNGLADGFVWPPVARSGRSVSDGHSAPGRLLEVADRLIDRAERLLAEARTVPDAVSGALLATEAVEYLGHRTPTTSLEALSLKHQLEVTAECMFHGVGYNMDVRSRLTEIRTEVHAVAAWFDPKTRVRSELNAVIGMVSRLLVRYRQYDQFDEEQQALGEIRALTRKLWLQQNAWLRWPVAPVYLYVDWLLGPTRRFLLSTVVWLAILGALFTYCDCDVPRPPEPARTKAVAPAHPPKDYVTVAIQQGRVPVTPKSAANEEGPKPGDNGQPGHRHSPFIHGLAHAVISFFGLQPPHDAATIEGEGGNYAALWIGLLAILVGFLHLGIMVSHLYSLAARK